MGLDKMKLANKRYKHERKRKQKARAEKFRKLEQEKRPHNNNLKRMPARFLDLSEDE